MKGCRTFFWDIYPRLSSMPAAHIESDPDARFRMGLAESHRGERSAFITLNTALEGFLARNDVKGAALASAAMVISGQVAGDFRRFKEHIARFVVVRDDAIVWRDRNDELTALTGLLTALNYFGPDDPYLPRCVERIMALLESELDVNVKFAAGRAILYYMEPRNLRALGAQTTVLGVNALEFPLHQPGHFVVGIFFQEHADERGHGDEARPQRRPALTDAVSPYLAAFELHVFVLSISKCIVCIAGTNR